jgi:hypothetical protein
MTMPRLNVSVTLDITVVDEDEFRLAAHNKAAEEGDHDPGRFMLVGQTSLGECAQMLLDPGCLIGANIDQSSYEDLYLLED